MGFTKSLAIEEANRNEAREAVAILARLQTDLFKDEKYVQAGEIREAIKLIEKFEEKYIDPRTPWDLK